MSFSKKFLSTSFISVIDQGMLSGLNLLIGMMLWRLIEKSDYGLYSLLYAVGLLAGLVIDSWIAGPLATVANVVHESARRILLRRYWYRQIFCTLWMGAVSFLVAEFSPLFSSDVSSVNNLMGLIFALYVIGNGFREYGRTVGFIQSDLHSVFRQDIVYVLAVVAGLALLILYQHVEVIYVFAVLAGSSFLSALFGRERLRDRTATTSSEIDQEDMALIAQHQATITGHGRWAVVGVIVGWLTNYSYLYLAKLWMNSEAVADLNASRLLLMPIPLIVAAWSRVARPEAGRLIAAQQWARLKRFTFLSIVGIEVIVVAYVGLLLLTFPFIEIHWIGSETKYHGLEPLMMMWGAYFAVNAVRWIGTTWLMSGGAFRSMFFLGTVTLILVLGITSFAIPYWGTAGAIFALIFVEIFETVVVWKFIFPRLQKPLETVSANVS
ncbi:lipopolysaccharide biosynthesis protein [Undibacterium sp. SXout11W]|uniref:lipopolysaccharide biosynthesis protein n=1 Tax=Undibacterium sp. SXout11W TaxID=3413050 RepID=UPI003BEF52B9